jgi:hypothetical protein
LIVKSDDEAPTGAGMMAALDAVAKQKANAAPRAKVRIIDCFLFFVVRVVAPLHRFETDAAGTYHRRLRRQ